MDKSKLKELALAATIGPWEWWTSNSLLRLTGADRKDGGVLHAVAFSGIADVECSTANRDFIAAANPAAILELLAERERLAAQLYRSETVLHRAGFNGDSVQGWTAPVGGSSPADAGGLTDSKINELHNEYSTRRELNLYEYIIAFGRAVEREVLATKAAQNPAPSAKQEPSAWQGMDTAPTDGTEILIRFPKQGNVKSLANYNTVHNFWMSKGDAIFPVEQGCEWTHLHSDAAPSASASPAAPDIRALQEQSQAWFDVCDVLMELRPDWHQNGRNGKSAALATIRALASEQAASGDAANEVIVDRRDLFDSLRAAYREGQSDGNCSGPTDTTENWHKATDYADTTIKGWSTLRAASPAAAVAAPAPANDWIIHDPKGVIQRMRNAARALFDAVNVHVDATDRTSLGEAFKEMDEAMAAAVGIEDSIVAAPVAGGQHVPEDLIDAVSKAMRRAFNYGQTYWQQADSESYSQNKKSDETALKFDQLVDETRALFAAAAPAVPVPVEQGWISIEDQEPESGQTVIILFWPYNNRANAQIVGQAEYVDGDFYTDGGEKHHPPSHWMPLPAAPSLQQGKEGAVS